MDENSDIKWILSFHMIWIFLFSFSFAIFLFTFSQYLTKDCFENSLYIYLFIFISIFIYKKKNCVNFEYHLLWIQNKFNWIYDLTEKIFSFNLFGFENKFSLLLNQMNWYFCDIFFIWKFRHLISLSIFIDRWPRMTTHVAMTDQDHKWHVIYINCGQTEFQ